MKSCELCKSEAKIYCDSDQASLCWTCDFKVHSANFLVARHSRCLLCRVCRSPTPWTASGEKVGPSAVSVCEKCVGGGGNFEENDDDDDDDEDESENEAEVEDGDDNQVVPLSHTPPPPTSSSNSSCGGGGGGDYSADDSLLVKRKRENVADLTSEDDCVSVRRRQHREVSAAAESSEAIKVNRGTLYSFIRLSSESMGEKAKRYHHASTMMKADNKSGPVVGMCRATKVVGLDLNSSDSS